MSAYLALKNEVYHHMTNFFDDLVVYDRKELSTYRNDSYQFFHAARPTGTDLIVFNPEKTLKFLRHSLCFALRSPNTYFHVGYTDQSAVKRVDRTSFIELLKIACCNIAYDWAVEDLRDIKDLIELRDYQNNLNEKTRQYENRINMVFDEIQRG